MQSQMKISPSPVDTPYNTSNWQHFLETAGSLQNSCKLCVVTGILPACHSERTAKVLVMLYSCFLLLQVTTFLQPVMRSTSKLSVFSTTLGHYYAQQQ